MSDVKLSEAIRKGAKCTHQITGSYTIWNETFGEITHACALGAAWVGIHGVHKDIAWGSELNPIWPHLHTALGYQHPISGHKSLSLYEIITDLNDEQNWTREQIADWLESQGE